MYNSKYAAAEAAASLADRKHTVKVLRELLGSSDEHWEVNERALYQRTLERAETTLLEKSTRFLN